MLKSYSILSAVIILFCANPIVQAQDVITSFAVEFAVTGDNPTVNNTDGDFLSYSYKDSKISMVLVNKMVDLKMVYDGESKKGILLNSLQSGATKIASPLDEKALAHDNSNIQVSNLQGSKKILGYKCSKAQVTLEDKTIEVWYVPKLKPYDFNFEGYFFSQLDGFPLLMIETSKDGILTSTATRVSLDLADNVFDQSVPEGYKTISFEQLNGGKK